METFTQPKITGYRQLSEAVEKILASNEPYRCDLEWPGAERRDLAVDLQI